MARKKKKPWRRPPPIDYEFNPFAKPKAPTFQEPKQDPRIPKEFELITREQWGAQPGYAWRPLHTPVRRLRVIYDLNMDRCTVAKTCKKLVFGIQRRHLHLGWPDINLNFVVCGDGNVYEGLGWTKKITRLDHHSTETANTVAIGCIGRYNRQTVPKRIKKTLDDFIKKSVEEGYVVKEIFDGAYWRIKQCCKL